MWRRRRPASAGLAGVLLALLVLPGTAGAQPGPGAPPYPLSRAAVIAAVQAVVADGAPSVVLNAVDETGTWSTTAGVADVKTGVPASPDAAFRIGSISKTFVAVAVLKLVAAGKIDLDAPINDYVPGLLTRGDVITIRELLLHTAGLGEIQIAHGNGQAIGNFSEACHKTYDPTAQVKSTDVQLFEPGTDYSYSNAGYIALQLVIEKVTGQPYAQVISQLILTPLGLSKTSFQDGSPIWPTPYLHGYADYLPAMNYYDEHLVDNTDCQESVVGAAGSGISTGPDLIKFLRALMTGQLLPDNLYQQMITASPFSGFYGLGIEHYVNHCGAELIGNEGGVYGYTTYLYASADGTRTMAVEMPLYTYHQDISDALINVLHAELCGTPSA